MSASQRRKGAHGELELAKLFEAEFGRSVKRRLNQTRDAGHDLDGMAPFRIECKRRKTLVIDGWLQQAAAGADAGEIPMVWARADGGEWCVTVPAHVALRWMREEMNA